MRFGHTEVLIFFNPIQPITFWTFEHPGGGGGGQICPRAFSSFPELLEGVTCSKKNLQLSSPKNLQFNLYHIIIYIYQLIQSLSFQDLAVLKKKFFFLYFGA